MSRLGSSSNLFGNLYRDDRDRTTSVFNQNPTGRAGQAASFAAAQQSALDKQNRQRQEAIAAATAQQQAVGQEATAAQQRQETARTEAFREQEFKLAEAKFQNQKAVELQQLEEQKRAAAAQNAFQRNQQSQQRSVQPASTQAQRAQGGDSMAQAAQNHTARLRGNLSPYPNQLTPGGYSMEMTLGARGNGMQQQQALAGLNQNRAGLGYQPVNQQTLSRFGNGASYNIAASQRRG